MNSIGCTVLSLLILCSFGMTQVRPRFIVITKTSLGFKEGKETYRLGMAEKEFVEKFGPAEGRLKLDQRGKARAPIGALEYTNDGLEVSIDPDGNVSRFWFYLHGNSQHKAAQVVTDRGIGAESSLRDIARIYGSPTDRKEVALDDVTYLNVFYMKPDSSMLGFGFENGRLAGLWILTSE